MTRGWKKLALAAVLACALAPSVDAIAYPDKLVTVIVPYPAGGATDIVARLVAQGLQEELGQSFVVDNRSGGAGMIGLDAAARAQPDGYTLLVSSTGPTTISPLLARGGTDFKPLERLEPIAMLASAPAVLLVRNGLPVKNLEELIALSKKSPGALNMASAGHGSLQRLVGEVFQEKTGVKWAHVPFRGSAPALNEMIADRVDVMVDVVPSAAPFVKNGQMRAIAVMSPKRSEQLPDVPTLEESGLKGFDFSGWHALLAPKGTPQDVVKRLNEAAGKAFAKPEAIKRLAAIGAAPYSGTPEQLRARIERELKDWANVIRAIGITTSE